MLSEYLKKVKGWCRANKSDLFTAAVIFLVGLGSFGLGRLSAVWPEKGPITVTEEASVGRALPQTGEGTGTSLPQTASAAQPAWQGRFVASKSGKYYYLPSCPGAARIKDANKIWFETEEEAKDRGLAPAANCPGL